MGGWALVGLWPMAEAALHLDSLPGGGASAVDQVFGEPVRPSADLLSLHPAQIMALGALSMVGALLVMVPVSWSYILVKRRSGYDQSVVHTLLILPVAVTGITLIVQDSVALAFSLAGIVAAVRFRTTLEDTKDAVYVFLAIAVGLAAGVQALALAFVLAVVFIALNLVLWKLGFGNIYVDQKGRTEHLTLGDVLAGPASAERAVAFGDRRLLDAMKPDDMREVAERMSRMEQYLKATGETKKERKSYSVLLVHTDRVAETQMAIEPKLQELSVRWSLAEIMPNDHGGSILEYLVRPRADVPEGLMMEAVRAAGDPHVRAAEMRSLRGIAKRL